VIDLVDERLKLYPDSCKSSFIEKLIR